MSRTPARQLAEPWPGVTGAEVPRQDRDQQSFIPAGRPAAG